MKLERLMELANVQISEMNKITTGVDVNHKKDNIQSLKSKLKKAGVNINGMSDFDALSYANNSNKITIEGIKTMKLERLMELSGQPNILNELDGIEVTHNKDNIQSLKAKLTKAKVDVSNMSDEAVLKFANKMDEITIESLKSKGKLKEQTED